MSALTGDSIRAVQITSHRGPEAVEITTVPEPQPGPNDVAIRVRAAGVAFPEVLMSRGRYQRSPALPFTPGAEIAGEVLSAPPGSGFSVGDRVAAVCLLGGFAEVVLAPPEMTMLLPPTVSFERGAAFIFNYATAHFALVERGGLRRDEVVLVHGAAGGLGIAAIQIARAFGAAQVIAVTSTRVKGAMAVQAGADSYVLVDGFGEGVLSRVPSGVDVIVDPVGGPRFDDSLRCLRPGGRLLVVGFTGGEIPTVKVNRLLLRNIAVVGVAWVGYTSTRPGHIAEELAAIVPHLSSGMLDPLVGATYPLEEAAQALRALDSRRAIGKVVITL